MNSWAFFDGNGTEITRGWQGHEDQARTFAQRHANAHGISVEFVTEAELARAKADDRESVGEVVEPEDDADMALAVAETRAHRQGKP